MEFETVERCGRTYVVKNGVESSAFVEESKGYWHLFDFVLVDALLSKDECLARIADALGDWYTAAEAATQLVEMGVLDRLASAHDICLWARNGLLPGSVKISAPGQGGSWRIPEAALRALAERRGQ